MIKMMMTTKMKVMMVTLVRLGSLWGEAKKRPGVSNGLKTVSEVDHHDGDHDDGDDDDGDDG